MVRWQVPAINMAAMNQPQTMEPLKAEAARRQLGTALALWLADADPTSVHVLACGGGEIAEALAERVSGQPMSAFILDVHQDITKDQLRAARNKLWNSMKHANKKNGQPRNDEALLAASLEEENESQLAVGWFDLSQVGVPLPIGAQLFNLWHLAKHGNRTDLGEWVDELFPDLHYLSPHRQKEMLRERIAEWLTDTDFLADPKTDGRPLIVPMKSIK